MQSFTPAQTQSSDPSNLSVVNGALYFSANDGIHGDQIWTSDGTPAGTTMVTNIPQSHVSSGAQVSSIVGFDGAIFLESVDQTGSVSSIYRSDGTPGGTSSIFTPDSSTVSMTGLTPSGNSLYFLTSESNDSGIPVELWKSDGTSSGTTVVTSIPNAYLNYGSSAPTDVNGKVYFAVENGSTDTADNQFQLWTSDGTASGTTEVTSLNGSMQGAVALGNKLVFTQFDSTGSGPSLWVSDGTAAGTVQLQDFPSSGPFDPWNANSILSMTVAGNTLYFVAMSGTSLQLWETDGTVAGTVPVTTANAGSGINNLVKTSWHGRKVVFLGERPREPTGSALVERRDSFRDKLHRRPGRYELLRSRLFPRSGRRLFPHAGRRLFPHAGRR